LKSFSFFRLFFFAFTFDIVVFELNLLDTGMVDQETNDLTPVLFKLIKIGIITALVIEPNFDSVSLIVFSDGVNKADSD
jgi:hypothetical protein